VADRDQLLALLGRVRWRLRAQAGAQGAVAGAAIALGSLLVSRLAGVAHEAWVPALVGLPVLAGPLVALTRRPALSRCARALDQAIEARSAGESRNGDRALVALALLNEQPAGARDGFVLAALRDAVRSARVSDVAAASPWRLPRGWPALPALGAALLVLGFLPARSHAVRPVPWKHPAPRDAVAPGALAAAAAMLEEARLTAARLQDPELAALASRLADLLEAVERGAIDRREAFDRLAGLAADARAAAADGEALREGLERAGAHLARDGEQRALGEAMASLDGAATRAAWEALAAAMGTSGTERDRRRLAEALDQAAAAAERGPGGAKRNEDPQKEQRRRLDQEAHAEERTPPGAVSASRPDERRLQRLERGLGRAADRCRVDPAACAQSLRDNGEAAGAQAREAERAAARGRLAEGLDRAQAQLGRDSRQSPGDGAAQAFERAARGQSSSAGANPVQAGAAEGGGEGTSKTPGPPATPGDAPAGAGESRGGAAPGGGEGHGGAEASAPDGPSGREEPGAEHGRSVAASVASGEGPGRAEVIEAGAREGFARAPYERVFRDYEAAVEETLDATAAPAGRRQLVRRYFELIRPRARTR
jgi:hypothetical protein